MGARNKLRYNIVSKYFDYLMFLKINFNIERPAKLCYQNFT